MPTDTHRDRRPQIAGDAWGSVGSSSVREPAVGSSCRLVRLDKTTSGHSVHQVPEVDHRSEWQRKYDESLAREQIRLDDEAAAAGPEGVAIEVGGCLPGWLGVGLVAISGIVVALRRRWRGRASVPRRPMKT